MDERDEDGSPDEEMEREDDDEEEDGDDIGDHDDRDEGAAGASDGEEMHNASMRGAGEGVVDGERRTTSYLTKYERARVLGTRALQIRCVREMQTRAEPNRKSIVLNNTSSFVASGKTLKSFEDSAKVLVFAHTHISV